MFDGNHRTRRTVNYGATTTTNNRRNPISGSTSTNNTANRKQSSRPIGGIVSTEIDATNNNVSNATILLEEAKRRRIERRIVQQRNTSCIIISKYYRGYIVRKSVLQQIESTIQQLLLLNVSSNTNKNTNTTDSTITDNANLNSITNLTFTNIRKVTVLFNLRYRLLLPITEQQQQQQQRNTASSSNSNRHKKSVNPVRATTARDSFLQQYVTYVINTIHQFSTSMIQDKEQQQSLSTSTSTPATDAADANLVLLLMLNALPSPYMAHRIVQKIILVLYHNNNSSTNVDDNKLITTLSFLLGIITQQQQQLKQPIDTTTITGTNMGTTKIDDTGKWKRLGNGSNFSMLLDCYFRRLQILQEQEQQNQDFVMDTTSTGSSSTTTSLNISISSMYSIIQQLVPSTQVGHAFQVAIQLTAPSSSFFLLQQQQQQQQQDANTTDTIMSASTTISSFTNLVEPLVLVISSSSKSSSSVNASVDVDMSKKVEDGCDQDLLIEATKRMISQSAVQLLLNAIQLYRQDIVFVSNEDSITRIRMTSLLVQLVQYVFCTPESTNNDNDKPIRTLLTILIGRKIRGDDINFATTTTTSKINDNSKNIINMNVNGLEDDDDDDDDDNDNDDDDDDINGNGKRNTTSLEASTTNDRNTITGGNNNTMSIDRSITESNSNRNRGGRIQLPRKVRNVVNTNRQQSTTVSTTVSARLQRHELLTSSKLDSIYKSYSKEYCQWSDDICGTIMNKNSKRKQNGGAGLLSTSRINSQIQLLDIQSIGKLTNELSNPDLILQWGYILFSTNAATAITKREVERCLEMGRTAFVTVLGILLQFTTGLRERQSYASTFISKLAFDTKLIAMIWTFMINRIQTERILLQNDKSYKSLSYLSSSTYLGFAIFADLFSHTLISAKDDTFVQLYTNAGTATTQYDKKLLSKDTTIPLGGFLAADVIVCIRDLLYELYWTKPVRVTDFDCILPSSIIQDDVFETNGHYHQNQQQHYQSKYIHNARARLFLSGTKLWNSLYERWTRLVIVRSRDGGGNSDDSSSTNGISNNNNNTTGTRRNDICDEATWWFPPMTGALSAGTSHSSAVVSASSDVTQRRRTNRRNNNINRGYDMNGDDNDEDMYGNSDSNGDEDDMSIDSVNTDSNSNHSQTMGENDDTAAVEAESDALAETFSDPKLARILTCIPQSVSFDKRVKLFDSLLRTDKRKSQVDNDSHLEHALLAMMRGENDGDFMSGGRVRINIRRDHLYEDSKEKLNSLGSANALKKRVQVSFTNQLGTAEAGIDGGGVFKEFIDDLIKDAFSAKSTLQQSNDDNNDEETTSNPVTATYQLFTVTPLQALRINSNLFTGNSVVDSELLPHYEFLGRVLGKAVYESILVEPQFCLPFLNQLLGKNNSIEDLKNYDPEYYRNLTKLLSLSHADIDSLGLYFEITSGSDSTNNGNDGMTRTVELFPGGSRVQVTKDNVIQFIHLIAHRRLNIETAQATKSFLIGFRDLIPVSWVRLFSAYELQRLISGDDTVKGIDVESFKASMQYAAGYHPSQPVIEWFWEIVEEMTINQQHKLLKFMTSCSRQPLLGFRSLEPAPCIQQIHISNTIFESNTVAKQAPLPTASTCMNLLKLPNYRSKDIMKQKIIAAIESGSGFELT